MNKIKLIPALPEDMEAIVAMKTDPALWEYEYDFTDDKAAIRESMAERLKSDWYHQFFIVRNDSRETRVGQLHIHLFEDDRASWEVGYCILPEFRRNGYCVEAVKTAFDYAFTKWGAHKVVAFCNGHNVGSYKVMDRAGMKRDAVLREELPWRQSWSDQYVYSILDHEYRNG